MIALLKYIYRDELMEMFTVVPNLNQYQTCKLLELFPGRNLRKPEVHNGNCIHLHVCVNDQLPLHCYFITHFLSPTLIKIYTFKSKEVTFIPMYNYSEKSTTEGHLQF